ncbi:MAG: thioredoxin [Deltaproteobacteria bacterium]|nr:thioredoxin [Deltaproteobacteria bacterium]
MSEHIQEVNEGNFEQAVLQSNQPVLVDFWAEWCGPCRTLAPIVEAVAEQHADEVQVAKLNVDDNPSVVQRYHIQGIPTLILFQDGEERERIIGVVSKEEISRTIDGRVSATSN